MEDDLLKIKSRLDALENGRESSEVALTALKEQGRTSIRLLEEITSKSLAGPKPLQGSPVSSQKSTLTFKNISFAIPGKGEGGKPKRILVDVAATVESGRVLAIMGAYIGCSYRFNYLLLAPLQFHHGSTFDDSTPFLMHCRP